MMNQDIMKLRKRHPHLRPLDLFDKRPQGLLLLCLLNIIFHLSPTTYHLHLKYLHRLHRQPLYRIENRAEILNGVYLIFLVRLLTLEKLRI